MRGRLIFLLEEPSMRTLLDGLLPRLFPGLQEGVHFKCVPHQGKSDLDKSIPIKLRAWRIPDDRFIVVRDNDSGDCTKLKTRLVSMCHSHGRPETLVRLVCQELESWYIGDLAALAAAFSGAKIDTPALRKRFVDPDAWQKPSNELIRLIPSFQKTSGARIMAQHLSYGGNQSRSYQVFVDGVHRVAEGMGYRAV